MDKFNAMLQDIDTEYENVHYIDLRSVIQPDDWSNEIHPKQYKFREIATIFKDNIRSWVPNPNEVWKAGMSLNGFENEEKSKKRDTK